MGEVFGVQDHPEWWAWGSGMDGQLWLRSQETTGGLWVLGRQRVREKDLGLAIKASLSRNPKHLSPPALARRSNFFFCLCPQGPERDRDYLRGPAGLGVAFEPGFLTKWPRPRHRELGGEASGSLESGLWTWREVGDSLCPPSPGCLPWVGWCRCKLQ